MAAQPSGVVTMLFTDIEGSTRLLERLGRDRYAEALELHRQLLREAFDRHDGFEVNCEGDAFFVAFPSADGAVAAALEADRALEAADWPDGSKLRVRIGLHTGEPLLAPPKYVGLEVHTAARIMAAGHGGQVLLSQATRDRLDSSVDVRALGDYRLKDLSAPERIYQLGSEVFPPLKTLHQTNLPVPPTPFLGRERELGEVLDLLSRDDVRLLTLTGPGGTGKTRLAAQAAGLAAGDYPDGVWWVPLARLRDPSLVPAAVAQAVGSKADLAEHIADKRLLLLLDNFEQVIDAAHDLAALLPVCPKADLLVTSREPLHISGEQEYAVLPFAREESLDFFQARARAVKPDFEANGTLGEICRRLDDLPLALELAAARVKALTPAQILTRLEQHLPLLSGVARDVPERQRTLTATISWSHELLSPSEQRLFARLSVFRGGCTLEAVEEVADDELDVLQSLVDKSLLRHTGDRFWMLETIRAYAAEQLERSGEAPALGARHAEYFLALAQAVEPSLRGTESSRESVDRLERENDNLRAALDWYEATGDRLAGLRLAGALSQFWYLNGHLAEGKRRLASALGADGEPTPARAKALRAAAVLVIAGGDTATGRLHAEEALAVCQELGDAWGVAHVSFILGHAAADDEALPEAVRYFEEAVRRFRELGDEHYALLARHNLAEVTQIQGDLDRARVLHEENLADARRLSDQRIVALSLLQLASHRGDEADVEDALSMLAEALEIFHALGVRLESVDALSRFASTLALTGRDETTAKLLASSETHRNEIGSASLALVAKRNEQTRSAIESRLDPAALAVAWEEGTALSIEEAIELALELSRVRDQLPARDTA
jgi:predicted ATPase/class 3 adenylate cyclase